MSESCHKQTGAITLIAPDHQSLRARLGHAAESGPPSMRAIASFMLAELSDLPFETAASLAARIGVSEVSIGRFCRAIG